MVRVLATAHMHPASTAHTTRCGACRTSCPTCDVPRINAGTLQRARKTPHTMISEMVIGEIPGLTSLMGASAPPSHAPAAKPQKIPNACRLRRRVAGMELFGGGAITSASGVNGVYPREGGRRPAREAESRSESRWRWRGTGCEARSRLDCAAFRPQRRIMTSAENLRGLHLR